MANMMMKKKKMKNLMTNKNAKYIVYNRDKYLEGKKFYIYY